MDHNKEEDHGYDLFPSGNKHKHTTSSVAGSLITFDPKCETMLNFAMEGSEYSNYRLADPSPL